MLKGQKELGIFTYSNFGLSYNRMRVVPVNQLKGSRLFWSKEMNVYQLEYNFQGRMTNLVKKRSYFYRPEHIVNQDLWNELKTGNEVLSMSDIQSAEELDLHRKLKSRSKHKS